MPQMRNSCSSADARARHERQPGRRGYLLKRETIKLRKHLAPEPRLIARLRPMLALPLTIAAVGLGDRYRALAIHLGIAARIGTSGGPQRERFACGDYDFIGMGRAHRGMHASQ